MFANIGVMVLTITASACLPADPTEPCDASLAAPASAALDLVENESDRVLALVEPTGGITVVRDRCTFRSDCSFGGELTEERVSLPPGADANQILLTSAGRHLIVRTADRILSFDLDQPMVSDEGDRSYPSVEGPSGAVNLVGALRGGRWIIYRDVDGLVAYDATENRALPLEPRDDPYDFKAVAMGDRHLVARRVVGPGEEELWLIPIDPSPARDELRAGVPKMLTRGGKFTRVVVTRAPPPPGSLEDPEPRPLDIHVIATEGSDPETARTHVFDVARGDYVDGFDGAVVTSYQPLNHLDGLSATSPDGRSVAYLTPRGSVALRKTAASSSCLVRSAATGRHRLAGFAADGRMFFEAHERDEEGRVNDRIYGYQLGAANYDALTPADDSYRLKAVPLRAHFDERGVATSWAIAQVDSGAVAVQAPGRGETPGRGDRLRFDATSFLPRDRNLDLDDSLWLLEASESTNTSASYALELARVTPLRPDGGALEFEDDESPLSCGDAQCEDDSALQVFRREFSASRPVCLAFSRGQAWAHSCATPHDAREVIRTGLPASEIE